MLLTFFIVLPKHLSHSRRMLLSQTVTCRLANVGVDPPPGAASARWRVRPFVGCPCQDVQHREDGVPQVSVQRRGSVSPTPPVADMPSRVSRGVLINFEGCIVFPGDGNANKVWCLSMERNCGVCVVVHSRVCARRVGALWLQLGLSVSRCRVRLEV